MSTTLAVTVPHNAATCTLIVRLWPERGDEGRVVWRGSIDVVQTGERRYFQSLEALPELIRQAVEEHNR